MEERKLVQLPPYGYLALLRAESVLKEKALKFLEHLKSEIKHLSPNQVKLLGPIAAPMARKIGRYRAQLLLHSTKRTVLQSHLRQLISHIDTLKYARQVRWSVDIDPLDMY